MHEKVGIILVNYNGEKYITDCIDSLLGQTYDNITILFWDNNSTDNSANIVRERYPQVYLIRSRKNYGFARANNMAVRRLYQLEAKVSYILLLNVDTVADPSLVEFLLQESDSGTVTTAHIYTGSHTQVVWYAGGELQLDTGTSRHLCIRNCPGKVQVTFISGCCMMVHRDIIHRYGLFDPSYYMYYEDTDLCMRWHLHGVEMYYVPKARLWHRVGGSVAGKGNPLKEYYMARNRLYFAGKYAGYVKINRYRLLYKILKDKLQMWEQLDYKMIRACCFGIMDFYLGKMGQVEHKI